MKRGSSRQLPYCSTFTPLTTTVQYNRTVRLLMDLSWISEYEIMFSPFLSFISIQDIVRSFATLPVDLNIDNTLNDLIEHHISPHFQNTEMLDFFQILYESLMMEYYLRVQKLTEQFHISIEKDFVLVDFVSPYVAILETEDSTKASQYEIFYPHPNAWQR